MHLLRSGTEGVACATRRVGVFGEPPARSIEATFSPCPPGTRATDKPGGRMKSVRRWALASVGSAAAGVVMAAAAFACVSGPVVNLSTINAKAGQEVGVTGTGFQTANAAQIRWNAL